MKTRIRNLINKYKDRCKQIEDEWCTFDSENEPVFDYDCDFDDQLMTTEIESEYYTLLNVIEELEEIVGKEVIK